MDPIRFTESLMREAQRLTNQAGSNVQNLSINNPTGLGRSSDIANGIASDLAKTTTNTGKVLTGLGSSIGTCITNFSNTESATQDSLLGGN